MVLKTCAYLQPKLALFASHMHLKDTRECYQSSHALLHVLDRLWGYSALVGPLEEHVDVASPRVDARADVALAMLDAEDERACA